MHEGVYWVGFIGAWLLFVGPVYQSALELREEEDARVSMQKVLESAPPPEPRLTVVVAASAGRDRHALPAPRSVRGDHRRTHVAGGSRVDRALQGRRRGWWYVGAGAWFIFLKEAWELAEHREWTVRGYWLTVVFMTMAALGGVGAGGDRSARERNRQPPSRRRRHHQPWRRAQTSSAELIVSITTRITTSWAQCVLSLTITFMP